MSKGPGLRQRAILDALDGGGSMSVDDLVAVVYQGSVAVDPAGWRTQHEAIRRALHGLADRDLVVLGSEPPHGRLVAKSSHAATMHQHVGTDGEVVWHLARVARMQDRLTSKPGPDRMARIKSLKAIIDAQTSPVTVRNLLYKTVAIDADLYTKDKLGAALLGDDVNWLRDNRHIDSSIVVDPSRIVRRAPGWLTAGDALRWLASFVRHDFWDGLDSRVAITCESDGLAMVLHAHLLDLQVPIQNVKGHASGSAIRVVAEHLHPATGISLVLHVGDADGQGYAIEADLRLRLGILAARNGAMEPTVERVWLSVPQAMAMRLPWHAPEPSKNTAGTVSHDKPKTMDDKYGFTDKVWEAEAGDPAYIAGLLRERIVAMLPPGTIEDAEDWAKKTQTRLESVADDLDAEDAA